MSRLGDLIAAKFGYVRKPARRTATFPAASAGRLTQSWTTDPGAINTILRGNLRTLRARSRSLSRSDGYASKFVSAAVFNIAGPAPFRMQAKIRRPRGAMDTPANDRLEEAWMRWSRKGNCDVTGTLSLDAIHRLVVRGLARDGEALIQIFRGSGREFGEYGIRLKVIDIDRLDEERNDDLGARGAIKLGVEQDTSGRPIAYHILRKHPGEIGMWGGAGVKEYNRVDAGEIIHVFVPDWPEQVRGIPWMHPAMVRLWNLGGFEEAAVISARIGACKMGFYVSPDGAAPPVGDGVDAKGNFLQDAEPGRIDIVPQGYDFRSFDPQFPDGQVEPFIRSTLRGIAAGLGVAYHSLANDPSNVNYSTARVALLEERDMWKAIQSWYIDHVCRPIYDAWRDASVAAGALPSEALGARYESVRWQAKTWDWVDPLKDRQAQIEALKAGLTSRSRIAAEQGDDIEDIFEELREEHELAEKYDLEFEIDAQAADEPPPQPAPAPDGEPPEAEPEEDEPTDGNRLLRAV